MFFNHYTIQFTSDYQEKTGIMKCWQTTEKLNQKKNQHREKEINSASLASSQVEPFSRQAVNSITSEKKSCKRERLRAYLYFQSAVASLYLA